MDLLEILKSPKEEIVCLTLQDILDFLFRFPNFLQKRNNYVFLPEQVYFSIKDFYEAYTTEFNKKTLTLVLNFLKSLLLIQIENSIYVPFQIKLPNNKIFGETYKLNINPLRIDPLEGCKVFGRTLFLKIEKNESNVIRHNANLIMEVNNYASRYVDSSNIRSLS